MRLVAFSREDLQSTGWLKPGCHRTTREAVLTQLRDKPFQLVAREAAEEDESLLQAVAYTIVPGPGGTLLAYQRASHEGEKRLHGNWSVGVGGHVEDTDLPAVEEATSSPGRELVTAFDRAACRELVEELALPMLGTLTLIGTVYDDSNAVGRVHLGFVYVAMPVATLSLESLPMRPAAVEYATPRELLGRNLETWSRLVLDTFGLPW